MKNLKQQLKNFRFIGHFPKTDWQKLFIAFTGIGFLVVGWSIYNFIQIKGEVLVPDSKSASARVEAENKERELQSVLDVYMSKEKRYKQLLLGNTPKPIAPATTTASTTGQAIN